MKLISNMGIGKRLASGLAIILFIFMCVTAVSILRLRTIANATHEMMELPLAKERLISDWYGNINGALIRATAIARSSDASLSKYFEDETMASSKKSSEFQEKVSQLLNTEAEQALFKQISEQRKIYISSRNDLTSRP